MKKLGLIGGVGLASTIPYYEGILYGVKEKVGKPFFPPLTIESLSCYKVIPMSNAGDTVGLTRYLLAGIKNLAAAGAEIGALACNTGHLVFEDLQKASPIPLISIVETACTETINRGYKRVGLLGTAATMEKDFFKIPFRRSGIEVVIPDKAERDYIADRILNELENNIINPKTADDILKITARMAKDSNLDAIILGCTELPLLFADRATPVPFLDTMNIHIAALINAILEE